VFKGVKRKNGGLQDGYGRSWRRINTISLPGVKPRPFSS